MIAIDRTQPRTQYVLHQNRSVRVPTVGRRDAALAATTVQQACDTMRPYVGRADVHPAAVMLKAAPTLVVAESQPRPGWWSRALSWLSRLNISLVEVRLQRNAAALLKKPIISDTQRALLPVVQASERVATADAARGYCAFAGDMLCFGAELAVLSADQCAVHLLADAIKNFESGYAWVAAQDRGTTRALLESQAYAHERLADVALDGALLTADLSTQAGLLATVDESYTTAWSRLQRAREHDALSPAGVAAKSRLSAKRAAFKTLLQNPAAA